MTPENAFRFLDLPAEIRVMIYKLTLVQRLNSVQRIHQRWIKPNKSKTYKPPSILRVNRQIHLEATILFYRSTTFWICCDCCSWLSKLRPEYRDEIQEIRCPISVNSFDDERYKEAIQAYADRLVEARVALKKGVLRVSTYVEEEDSHCWINELGDIQLE